MEESVLYVTGLPGFKEQLMTMLDRGWLKGMEEIGEDTIRLSLPDNLSMDDVKEAIGTDAIADHHLKFSNELSGNQKPMMPRKFVLGQPIKMSVWVNSNSKLGKKRSAADSED